MTRGFLASLSTQMALSTADGSARHLGGAGHLRIFLEIEPFLIIISLPIAERHLLIPWSLRTRSIDPIPE